MFLQNGVCLFLKRLIRRCLIACQLNQPAGDPLLDRLSHEVRTLLTGVVGYAEFLETESTGPMVGFTAKIIRENGQALSRVNSAYFDLQGFRGGRLRSNASSFDFLDFVCKAVDSFRSAAFDGQIYLTFYSELELGRFFVNSDRQKALQVVNSIVYRVLQIATKHSIFSVNLSVRNTQCVLCFEYASATDLERSLEAEFWQSPFYHYQLQSGPGVEMVLAKELISLLGWSVSYRLTDQGTSKLNLVVRVLE